MATKVGEGYIEITPRLTGFNRELLRNARARLRELEQNVREAAATISVRPKITGITKAWQREIQQELNSKITGLTVDVKVRLENQALKATFNNFTVEAKNAGQKAGNDLSKGFKKYIGDVHRDINSVNVALKSGFKPATDPELQNTVKLLGQEFRELSADIDNFSNKEVRAINVAVNSFKTLHNAMDRETNKAAREFERNFNDVIRSVDRFSEKIRTSPIASPNTKATFLLARALESELKEANKVADSLFPDLNERIAQQGQKGGQGFTNAFMRAFRANFFDNLTDGILRLGTQFVAAAVSAQPLLAALSNLAGGAVALGSVVVDLYGSFLALPAVWAAVAQATTVLSVAFFGVSEALTALANEEQHAAANAAVQARQIEAAQERIADAKDRLARTVESTNASIARAEEAVADASRQAAERIEAAQARVADAHESAARAIASAQKRIEDAQKNLSRAYESAADRIAAAENRHRDSVERVREAQEDLNRAYEDALDRFRDLNIALGNAVLDEEGARLAIERAKERLDETLADPTASDLDRREADLAYRQALQRLAEVQKRQSDLREEVAEANREGVEGSDEVTRARERLKDAQEAEIEAQKAIIQAHKDASEQISDAQERVAEAQAALVEAQLDGARRIQEAEADVARAREQGARDIEEAQKRVAEAHKNAARSIADAQKDVARAIDNLSDVQAKQNEQWFNAQYALSQLSPEAQKFVRYIDDTFIPRLQKVQFSIQDAFFPPIQLALSQSEGLIDLFQVKLTDTAGIFGTLIGRTIEWLNQPETINGLGRILDSNNRLFGLLGEAGLNMGDVFLVLAEEAGPFVEHIGKLAVDFSSWIREIVSSEEGRAELAEFFENVRETVDKFYELMKLVGPALFEVYQMARPYGQDLLDDITDIAKRFNEWVNSTEGKTKIEQFLENGTRFLKEIFLLIEDIAVAFFELGASNDMSGLIKTLREDLLPAVLRLLDAFGGGDGGGGLVWFLKVVAIGVDALSGSFSLLAALVSGIWAIFSGDWSGARDSFADFLDSVRGIALTTFGEALPESFRTSSEAFNESVRGMRENSHRVVTDFDELDRSTRGWADTSSETSHRVVTDFGTLADDVSKSTARYRDDVDGKTKDAKTKAEQNTRQQREAVIAQMRELEAQSKRHMEQYRRTVDDETKNAKDASNRNVGDIVTDASTLLVPFSSVFREAANRAQEAIKNPGASWRDVGVNIIQGLWDGVVNMIPNLLTSIWNLGVDIVNTINRALGNQSPSKKMRAAGINIGEGLSLGIESMVTKVSRSSQRLAKSVTDAFGSPSLEVGVSGPKVTPTVGQSGIAGISGGVRNVNNITVYGAPNIPTEKQIANVLKYQEALYGDD